MSIPTYDFSVKAGNTGTIENPDGLVVRVQDDAGNPRDLSTMEIVFFAHWSGKTRIKRSSADNQISLDTQAGKITVAFGTGDFSDARAGQDIRYELEQRENGHQRTILQGKITLHAGISDD